MEKNINSEQKANVSTLAFSSDPQSSIKTQELCDSQERVVMNLDRELISKFGNAVFQCPETVSIIIRVDFKDGGSVGFQRDKEIEEDLINLRKEEK